MATMVCARNPCPARVRVPGTVNGCGNESGRYATTDMRACRTMRERPFKPKATGAWPEGWKPIYGERPESDDHACAAVTADDKPKAPGGVVCAPLPQEGDQ